MTNNYNSLSPQFITGLKTRLQSKGFLFLLFAFFSVFSVNAQVDVTSTGGTSLSASYTTLKGAFDAINPGILHTGNITIGISGNTTETATAVLNASGSGGASYASISITPTGGVSKTISGAIPAGSPLINLNGADNVTFNGLNTGGNALTLSNTTASATSGTCTILFIGGATSNTITNCSVLGSFSGTVATNGGTIFFSTDGVTANGNDNNTISNNNIGPAGANLPTKAILGNGSTTTTALGNSGITITNNNIFDYFGAAVTSSGIATNGGCNTWSITNNRFYQTATRTWTTGATHRAIDINNSTATSGAAGFTITGNIIGYASNTQTGVYTLTGSTGKFQGIFFSGITTGTISNINTNTIASVSLTAVTSSGTSTSSPFTGILVSNGLANTNSNTIGSQSATGSLVFSTTTTTATDVIGLYNFSSDLWGCSSNTVGGISVTNAGASGTFIVYGIRANTGTSVALTASTNLVGGTIANSIQLNSTGTASQVIGIHTQNAPAVFTSNTIRNLTNNNGTGTTTTASVIGINITTSTPNHTVSQNTIFNLSNTNATAASVVTGIQFTGSTANLVERNNIYGLTAATNSASAEINGIRVAGGTTTYRNNMIALGAGVSNAIGAVASNSATLGINGINEALGTNNFYHNSVYIGGTATAGSGASYAFNGTQTSNTRAFRDNIFFNARSNSGATGKHYAVKINGTAANPTGLTINNNLYFANGSGAFFGFFNSLDVADLAAWKTAVGQDASSFYTNPQFLDPTNATPDLHINPGIVTVAEGNGVDLGVTDDFDGQTRSGLTPVDIGADAGNFTGLDLAPPTIAYTPLSSLTCVTTARTLVATITDISGVPTVGSGLPVLYWKINAGSYTAATATSLGSNQYQFSFGSGVSVGDTVSYYIVAQDGAATPNIISNPLGSVFTANPPAASTPPVTPSSYTIGNSIGGSYDIGATAPVYRTLTDAINAYNTSCLSGPVTFNLVDASYTETAAMTINANSDASATNTLTIKPTLANTTIALSSGSTSAVFVLNGADWVTIDGSINSTANTVCPAVAASRDLTITNTNAGTSSAVVWLQNNGTDGATNNKVINCNLVGNSNTTTLFGVGSGSSTIALSSVGTGNNSNSFVNNNISKTQYGIFSQGASAANKNSGNVINQNLINTVSPNNVSKGGIVVGFENNITISRNNVSEIAQTSSPDVFGIAVGMTAIGSTSSTGNEVTNAIITNNIIGSVLNSGTFSAAGITVASATSGTTLVANNMISGVAGNGTSGDFSAGIIIGGGAGSTTNVYYNTVSMQGTIPGATAASQTSACLAVTNSTAPTLDLRNNIFTNTQTGNTGATLRFAAIALGYSTFATLTSNNNNLWVTGAGPGTYTVGITGTVVAGTNSVTLANWQTTTGKDAASQNILPVFTSATDLHLIPANNITLNDLGTPVTVTDDFDCGSRSVTTPDMGADEFSPPTCATAVAGSITTPSVNPQNKCVGDTVTMSTTGADTGLGLSYQWEVSTTGGGVGFSPVSGGSVTGIPPAYTTGTLTQGTFYYRLKVTCEAGPIGYTSNELRVNVNALPSFTVSSTSVATTLPTDSYCLPANTATTLTGSDNTLSYAWTTTNGTLSNSGAGNPITGTPTATALYTATGTDGNGCKNTATKTITLTQTPSALTIAPTSASICSGGSVNLVVNGGLLTGGGGAPGTASATSGAITLAIPDNNTIGISNTLAVNGIPAGAAITKVEVNFNITHTFDGDLKIHLGAPNGKIVNLVGNRGSSGDNFTNTTITSDLASASPAVSTGTSPFTGSFKADLAAGGLANTTVFADLFTDPVVPNTNWTLSMVDSASGDTGALTGWTITVYYTNPLQAAITWTPNPSSLNTYSGASVTASPSSDTTYTASATLNGCSSTKTVAVSVVGGMSITTDPQPTAKCTGQNAQFKVVAAGPGLSYQWYKGSLSTPVGTNSDTLNLTNITAADAANYFVVVSSSCGGPLTSASAALTVNALPTSVPTSNSPVCLTQTLQLTGGTDIGTSYSWTGPNGFAASSQNPSITAVTSAAAGNYSFKATSAAGCESVINSTTVVVNPNPSPVVITPASATICSGGFVNLVASGGIANISGTATATSGAITLAIPDNSTAGVSSTLAVSGIPSGAAISKVEVNFNITHTWDNDLDINLEAPNGKIVNLVADKGSSGDNFTNTTVTSDSSVLGVFTDVASAAPFTGIFKADLTAQGTVFGPINTQVFADLFTVPNGNWKFNAYDDTGGDTGTITNWTITVYYTNPIPASITWIPNPSSLDTYSGASVIASPTTETTYTATSTVNGCSSSKTVVVSISSGAIINNGPVATAKCAGQNASFTVDAAGPGLSYQWYKGTLSAPVGTNSATLNLTNVTAADDANYFVVVSATCGTPQTSSAARLTVNALPTSVPTSNSPVCTTQTLQLNGGTDIGTSYSWTGPNGFSSSSQNPSITNVSSAAAGSYSLKAISIAGCESVISTTTVVINTSPSPLTIAPLTSSVCAGASVNLVATGGTTSGSSGTPGTATATSGAITLAIPDVSATGINNTLNVSGIPTGATITNVSATFSITHGFDSDVIVNLEAPNGKIINLVNGIIITTGANFTNTIISSSSTTAIPATGAPFTSTYKADAATTGFQLSPSPLPNTALFSDLFTTPNGDWKIRVYDDESIGSGSLTNWSITINYSLPIQGAITWTPNPSSLNTYSGASVTASPTSDTTYTATTTVNGCEVSTTANIYVTPLPSFSVVSNPICKGGSANLTAFPTISGEAYNYDWTPVDGGITVSGNPVTLSPSLTTTYNVVATRNSGLACSKTVQVTVIVNDPGSIITQPIPAVTSNGFGATFTVAGTSGITYTYQWQRNGVTISDTYNAGTGLGNYAGTNSATLNIYNAGPLPGSQANNNTTYRCILTPPSPCATLTSTSANLTVGSTGIATNPQSLSICLPAPTSPLPQFTVVTNGANPSTLVWGVSTTGGATYTSLPMYNISTNVYTGPLFNAATGLTFGMPIDPLDNTKRDYKTLTVSGISASTHNNLRFRATVNTFVNSQPAILTLSSPVTFDTNLSTAAVTRCKTPTSTTPTTYSITTSGTVSAVQWRYDTSPGGSFANVVTNNTPAGATYVASSSGSTYSLAVTTSASTPAASYYYKAFVTATGACSNVVSDMGTIIVPDPVIGITSSANAYCTPGSAVSLTGTGGDSYTWSASDSTALSGNPVLVTPSASTIYTVTGTDSNGCTNTATKTITVGTSFTVAASSSSATVCEGGAVTLGAFSTLSSGPTYLVNTTPYNFAASVTPGAFVPLVGGINSGLTSLTLDEGMSPTITPAPTVPDPAFSFTYGGTAYTTFRVSSNGYLVFGGSGANTATNDLATSTSTRRPGLAPLWDDLSNAADVTYKLSGTAPNRVLTVQWLNVKWNWTAANPVISFQIKLYETTNAIEYIYRQEAQAYNAGTTGGASIGLMGIASTNYVSLQNASATPTISTTASTNNIATKPATDQVYRFVPAPAAPTYTYAWTPAAGLTPSATAQNPVSPALIGSTTYNVTATTNSGCTASASTTVTVIPTPVVTATNNGQPSATRCGFGKVILTATGTGTSLNWYAAATGGSPLFTGPSYQTGDLNTTTPYWVETAVTGSPASKALGAGASTSSSSGSSPFYHGYGGQKAQYIVRAADLLAAGFSAGSLSSVAFEITTLGTTTLNGFTISIGTTAQTAAVSNTAVTGLTSVYTNAAQTMALGVNTYPFSTPFNWDGSSNLVVQVSYSNNNTGGTSSAVKTDTVAYNTTLGIYADNATAAAVLAATSSTGLGSTSSNTTTAIRPKMTFGFATACVSARTQVNAVVTPAPALALSSSASTICLGQSTSTVNITPATVGNYTTYEWSPAATVSGTAATGYVFTPAVTTTYTLTGTGGGCVAIATHIVTVNPVPTTPVVSSNSAICQGSTLNLTATVNSNSNSTTLLSQNFESSIGTWLINAGSTGGANPSRANFAIKAHGTQNTGATLVTFNSPGGNNFIFADPDGAGSGVVLNTQLTSPSFSTVGYSAASLTFRHYYRHITTNQTVQISTDDGATWTNTLVTYSSTQGTPTDFATANVSLNAFIGQSNLKIRFNYTGGWIWYWAIDDISITGTPPPSFAWTGPNGAIPAVQNPSITNATPADSGNYSLEVTNSFGCKATATVIGVTVNPLPTAVAPANQQYYNNLPVSAIPLSGSPVGVLYDISVVGSIGLNATYTGVTAVPAFTPTTGTATVTVTPKANGCTGPSVSYNIVVAAVTADPIANQTYCEGITTSAIPLTSTPTSLTGVTYNLQVVGDNIGLSDATGLTAIPAFVTQPGSATIYITPVYGGVSGGFVSATITVNPLPTASAGGSARICSNATATVSGATSSFGTILWTVQSGAGSITAGADTLTPTYTAAAGDEGTAVTLTMTVTSTNTCSPQTATATYTVNVDPLPTASAGGSTRICSNATATVSGATSSFGTISWTVQSGAGSITAGADTLTPTYTAAAGDEGTAVTLTMTVTSTNTCSPQTATATYTVNVDPLPKASAGGSTRICSNATATLSGATSSFGTISWTTNGLGTLANAGTLTPTYTAAAGDEGTAVILTMTVTSTNTCSPQTATATYTVNVDPLPTASTSGSGSKTICSNSTYTLTASEATAANGAIAWTLVSGAGFISNGSTSEEPTYTASSGDEGNNVTLKMTVTSINTCSPASAVAFYTFRVDPLPTASTTGSGTKAICSNSTYKLTAAEATAAYGDISWSVQSGAGSITAGATTEEPTYSAVAADAGNDVTLVMTVTSNNACGTATATASYTFRVDPLPTASTSGSGTKSICSYSSYTLTTSEASAAYGTIVWTENGAGSITAGGTTLTPTYSVAAGDSGQNVTLTMTVTSNNACGTATASATYTLYVYPIPTVTTVLPNRNYYAGFATAAIPLTGTPSGVTFTITGGAAAGLADVSGVLAIPSFIPTTITVPTTVTVTPVANGCNGIPKTYQISMNPVIVNMTANQCGSINTGLNNQLQAQSVTVPGYTVTGYRFEITNTATGEVAYVNSVQSHFKLTDTDIYAYGTTFAIRVAVILNGNPQGFFGNTCTLTTASVATTKVVTAQCGATLLALNSTINANAVSSTNLYRFRVALASAPTTYYLLERTVPNFNLSLVPGLPLLYNTEYKVDVQIRVKLAGFEAWSQFGQVCSVFTPDSPTTSLILVDCDLLAEPTYTPSNTETIHIIAYPGASGYRVRLTGFDEFGDPYYNIIDIAGTTFTLSQFTGLTADTFYNVEISILLFGNYTPYGKTCSLTTPASARVDASTVVVTEFKATAYPNPYTSNFMIAVKTSSQSVVNLKVYDMIGRLVEQRDVIVSDMETSPIGDRYPSGVYNVVVTQDETVQTVRVVKR